MADNNQIIKMEDKEIMDFANAVKDAKIRLPLVHLSRIKELHPTLQRDDFENYIIKAQVSGANPLKDQIYLIPFNQKIKVHGEKDKWVKKGSVIYAYHFFISKAEASGVYDGFEVEDGIGDYMNPDTKEITKEPFALCKVYRKDRNHATVYKAWLPEFIKKDKYGNINSQWKKYMIMLQKCAVCNAHRQAFPEELGFMETDIDMQSNRHQSFKVDEEIDKESIEIEGKEVKEEAKTEPYFIPFGPLKGKDISVIRNVDLRGFYNFVKEQASTKETISTEVQTFLEKAEEVLK